MMVKAEKMIGDIKVTTIYEQSYKGHLAQVKISYTATYRGLECSPELTEDSAIQSILNKHKEKAA